MGGGWVGGRGGGRETFTKTSTNPLKPLLETGAKCTQFSFSQITSYSKPQSIYSRGLSKGKISS